MAHSISWQSATHERIVGDIAATPQQQLVHGKQMHYMNHSTASIALPSAAFRKHSSGMPYALCAANMTQYALMLQNGIVLLTNLQ